MASCHSSRELGSHGRSCQFDWGSFHARALRGVRDRCGSCGVFMGSRRLGGASHEPLQWTLQGVLGAEVQAGLYLPCTSPVPACGCEPWVDFWVSGGSLAVPGLCGCCLSGIDLISLQFVNYSEDGRKASSRGCLWLVSACCCRGEMGF